MSNKLRKRHCLERITPYVPGKPIEEVERDLGVKNIIKMASNENPAGPSPYALKAIEEAMGKLHLYPDSNAYYLKEALAEKHGVDMDQIIVGNGSDENLKMFIETYINPGDEAVIADPSFPIYDTYLCLMDGVSRMVPVRSDLTHDIEAMANAINKNTRMVFLCSPNNPTGTIITRDELEYFLEKVPGEVLVVLDEAYFEFVNEPGYFNAIEYIKSGYNLATFRTFSKIYGLAGIRVGYTIAPKEVIEDVNHVRDPFNVNSLAQAAALAALKDNEHVQKSIECTEKGKALLYNGLREMGIGCAPSFTNFVFIDLGIDSRLVFQELLKKGIIIRSGDIYGYPNYARVTIGTEKENKRFLKELVGVLKNLKANN